MDRDEAVDRYLRESFGLGLHRLLLAGCLEGRLPPALDALASVDARLVRSEFDADLSDAAIYRGRMTLGGCSYRFTLGLYVDRNGRDCTIELSEFDPVAWQAAILL